MNKLIKPVLSIAVAILFKACAIGQPVNKYVNSAEALVAQNSEESLIEAKDEIDKAYGFANSKDNPRMWLMRSMVYSRIYAKRGNEMLAKISTDAGLIAGNAMVEYWHVQNRKRDDDDEAKLEVPGSFIACFNESFGASSDTTAGHDAKLVDYYRACIFMYDKLDTGTLNTLEKQQVNKKYLTEKLGLAAYHCKDVTLKISVLQELVDGGAKSPLIIEALSKAYIEKGDSSNGVLTIRKAIEKDPTNSAIFQLLINYYVSIGREDLLFGDLNAQIEKNPESKLYYARGVLYERRDSMQKAINDYQLAIYMDEFNYDAQNNYARAILLYKRNALVDKRNHSTGEAKKKAEQDLMDLYAEAKKHLEMAAENTNYSATELINIYKTLKNISLEMDNKAEADKYEAKIKALE